jgi:hypothetical protein
MPRPCFRECYEAARSWQTRTPELDEITTILRTLASGSDPRTCRVTEAGEVVAWTREG